MSGRVYKNAPGMFTHEWYEVVSSDRKARLKWFEVSQLRLRTTDSEKVVPLGLRSAEFRAAP